MNNGLENFIYLLQYFIFCLVFMKQMYPDIYIPDEDLDDTTNKYTLKSTNFSAYLVHVCLDHRI